MPRRRRQGTPGWPLRTISKPTTGTGAFHGIFLNNSQQHCLEIVPLRVIAEVLCQKVDKETHPTCIVPTGPKIDYNAPHDRVNLE